MEQSHDGTSYNPNTTYPGHVLLSRLPSPPPRLTYLLFERPFFPPSAGWLTPLSPGV